MERSRPSHGGPKLFLVTLRRTDLVRGRRGCLDIPGIGDDPLLSAPSLVSCIGFLVRTLVVGPFSSRPAASGAICQGLREGCVPLQQPKSMK